MERLITFTSISAVTICSILLALLIEAALLKAIFHFMSHISTEPAADVAPMSRRLLRGRLARGTADRQLN